MKKLILLLSSLFLVSGCSSNYLTQKKLEDKGYYCSDNDCVYEDTYDSGSNENGGMYFYTSTTSEFNFDEEYYFYSFYNSVMQGSQFLSVEKWLYYYETETEKSSVTYYVDAPNNYFVYQCGEAKLTYYDGELFNPDSNPDTVYCISNNTSEYSGFCQDGYLKCSLGYNQYLEDKVD